MTAVTWSIAAQVTWWDTKKICQKIKPYKKSHDLHMTLMWLQSHDLLSHLTNTLSYQSAYIITGQCRENEKERRETEDGFEIRSERGSKRRAWRRAGREFCGVRATAPTLPPCMDITSNADLVSLSTQIFFTTGAILMIVLLLYMPKII